MPVRPDPCCACLTRKWCCCRRKMLHSPAIKIALKASSSWRPSTTLKMENPFDPVGWPPHGKWPPMRTMQKKRYHSGPSASPRQWSSTETDPNCRMRCHWMNPDWARLARCNWPIWPGAVLANCCYWYYYSHRRRHLLRCCCASSMIRQQPSPWRANCWMRMRHVVAS